MKVRYVKLEELIEEYAQNKHEYDFIKKECDRGNSKIKDLMTELNLDVYTTDEHKVIKSIQHRQTLNEDVLLDYFLTVPAYHKIAQVYGIVKTKSYVDMDALEKAIYDGGFSDEQLLELNKAKEYKDVVTLRLTKNKKKENEDVY